MARFLIKVNLPEIDGHDNNYITFLSATSSETVAFSKRVQILRKDDNLDTESIVKELIKFLEKFFKGGNIFDLELNKERVLTIQDIKELPLSMLDELSTKIGGSDLKVS